MNRRPRVLIVSYHFPPVGGAGVQRVAKFARYLPESGWDVSILRCENPSVPLLDPSLLEELPTDLVVAAARTLEPSYAAKQAAKPGAGTASGPVAAAKSALRRMATVLLQPDAQILWYPAAVREGQRLLRRLPHDAILATSPTYTNLLVGARLARASGLPLLSDFRDEWDISASYWENAPKNAFALALQRRMQRRVLRASAGIVATTELSTRRIAERATEAGAQPLARCIYNGWDAEDIARARETEPSVPRDPGRFRLVYAGTLWNLTSIAPLARALTTLKESHPELLARLELVVVGRKTPEQQQLLDEIRATGTVLHDVPYAPHSAALATMLSADALLLLLSDLPAAERVAPAKAFEYFAVGRPILAILPEGETAALVRQVDPEAHCLPGDHERIVQWLVRHLAPGAPPTAPRDEALVTRFERRHQAGELADLLTTLRRRGAP